MSSQKFSKALRVASEVSGMFLAIAVWYGICKGGFGTGSATLKNTLRLAEKKLRSVQIKSTRESCIFEYLNIVYAGSIIRTLSSAFRNSKRHTHK